MKLLTGIIKEIEKLKIRDIKVYNGLGKSMLADYFIVSTADSIIQLEAVRNKLIDYMDKHKVILKNPMEEWHGGWSLLDFGDIIVHTFLEELRSFYDIDSLLTGESYHIDKIKALKQNNGVNDQSKIIESIKIISES